MAAVFLGTILLPAVSLQAETAKEWEAQIRKDSDGAMRNLRLAYANAKADAVNHYKQTGDLKRVALIERMEPNIRELTGRVLLAGTDAPDTDLERIMKGYIIQASRDLMSH